MTRLLLVAVLGLAAAPARGQQPPPSPFDPPGRQPPPGQSLPPGQPGQPVPLPPGTEVLARGPVHECFAEPAYAKVSPTPVVQKPPPPPVEELPPDQRPEGDVEWVAGYWFWDDERNDHIWVSGCWRDDPPGRDWLPGRWERVRGGYHWVSGCWVPEGQDQVQLLPPPPAPLDEPQAQRPPWVGMTFVPGTWVWQQTQYAWRPGKWVREPADWVWQAASYTWTPGGYLFTDGYWDRPLRARGLLFAPCHFPAQVVAARRVAFEPQYAVSPDFLEGALFVRAATKHYHFGDFFEARYQQAGYVPWTDYRVTASVADPLFAHYQVHKPAPNWEVQVRALYAERYAGRAPRPPHTLVAQQQYVRTVVRPPAGVVVVAPPPEVRQVVALAPVAQVAVYGVKVTRVTQEHRVQYQQFAQQRVQVAAGYQEQAFRRVTDQHQGQAHVPQAPYSVKLRTVTRSKVITRTRGPGNLPPPPQFQFRG